MVHYCGTIDEPPAKTTPFIEGYDFTFTDAGLEIPITYTGAADVPLPYRFRVIQSFTRDEVYAEEFTIANDGEVTITVPVSQLPRGEDVGLRVVTSNLPAGYSGTGTTNLGRYTLYPPATEDDISIGCPSLPTEPRVGDVLVYKPSVSNGSQSGASVTVALYVDDSAIADGTVSVPAGEQSELTFEHEPVEPGEYTIGFEVERVEPP